MRAVLSVVLWLVGVYMGLAGIAGVSSGVVAVLTDRQESGQFYIGTGIMAASVGTFLCSAGWPSGRDDKK